MSNDEMVQFQPGEYFTRSIANYDCIKVVTVTRRTDKSVWVEDRGKVRRYKIHKHPDRESFSISTWYFTADKPLAALKHSH